MLRYVHVGRQIVDDGDYECSFAIYDTVCDEFLSIGADEVFDDWKDFE